MSRPITSCSKMSATKSVTDTGTSDETEALPSARQPEEHHIFYKNIKGLPWKVLTAPLKFRRARIITVEPTVFLFVFAMSTALPISEQFFYQYYAVYYLRQLNHTNLTASGMCIDPNLLQTPLHPDRKDSPSVEHYVRRDSSHFIMYYSLLSTVLQAISILLIGPLTDTFGRKMGLIIASTGAGIQYGILLIVVYFQTSLYVSLIGAVITGITGGLGMILTAAFAYAADVSSHKTRTLRIGLATASYYVAGAISEYSGGIWLNRNHCTFEPLLWCTVALSLAAIVYTIIGFPESRHTNEEHHPSRSRTNRCFTCSARCVVTLLKAVVIKFWKGLRIFFRPRLETIELWLALLTQNIYILNAAGMQLIGVLFYKAYPLHWSPAIIGKFDSLCFALQGIVIFFVFPIVTVGLKLADSLIVFLGIIPPIMMYLLVAYFGEGLVTWQMFLFGSLTCSIGMIGPGLRSLMSKRVEEDEQGLLFSVVGCTEISLVAVASAVYNGAFPVLGQNSFYLMSGLYAVPIPALITLLIIHFYHMHKYKKQLQSLGDTYSTSHVESLLSST